jgi:hypothetical protein
LLGLVVRAVLALGCGGGCWGSRVLRRRAKQRKATGPPLQSETETARP